MTDSSGVRDKDKNQGPEAGEQGKKFSYQIETPVTGDYAREFLEVFATILRHTNYRGMLDLYAKGDLKCGRCATMCHVYRASGDPKDIPCQRTGLMLKIYQRYFTGGTLDLRRAASPDNLKDADIDELIESLYRCTMCRRCTMECPMGMDHSLTTRLGRYILSEMNIVPRALQVAVRNQLEGGTKNIANLSLMALKDTVEFLEEDLEEMTGRKIPFPIGKKNVDYVFFPPVSDFMTEAETLMGHAAAMYAMGLGDNWTLGDLNYEAKNYGYYYSDLVYERIVKEMVEETRKLGGRYIVIGECGHATRASRLGVPMWGGDNPPKVLNSIELLYDGVKSGRIKLNPYKIKEKVTYHDPCNIARNSDIVDQPRYIIRQFIKNFVEMSPRGKYNFCCGAGPAAIDELKEHRMAVAGKEKAEQLKASGADIVISPCANCKKQISQLIDYYELPMERKGLHELVMEAIIWE